MLRFFCLGVGGQGLCSPKLGKGNREPGPEKLQKIKVAQSTESLVCQLYLGDLTEYGMLKDRKVALGHQESWERLGLTSLLI